MPHLIQPGRTVESARKQREKEITQEHFEIPVNELDLAIFKCLPRLPHGLPRVVEKEKMSLITPTKTKRDKSDKERHVTMSREKSFTMLKSQAQMSAHRRK